MPANGETSVAVKQYLANGCRPSAKAKLNGCHAFNGVRGRSVDGCLPGTVVRFIASPMTALRVLGKCIHWKWYEATESVQHQCRSANIQFAQQRPR